MPVQTSEYFVSALKALEHKVSSLQQVCEMIGVEADLETLLKKLLEVVLPLVHVDAGIILLLDEKGQLSTVVARSLSVIPNQESDQEKLLKALKIDPDKSMAGKVLATGEPVIIEEADKDPQFQKQIAAAIGYSVRNVMAVPLETRGQRLGVLEVFNKQPEGEKFTNEDLSLLAALVYPMALIIENASLKSHAGSQLTELTVLIRSLEMVNSSLSLDQVLENLMNMAQQLISAEAASILLLDEELGQLYFAAATGVKKEEVKKIYLKKGEGVAGWVHEHGEPLLIPDVQKDPRFSSKADKSSGFVTRSILAVPLNIENHLIGVAEAINKRGEGEFGSRDVQLLTTLASSGAMAIQKARLYQDVNELFFSTLRALADAIEAKDPASRGQAERLRQTCGGLVGEMNYSEGEQKTIELVALLHDVGKIAVPEAILHKQERLTDEEYKVLMRVPVIGAEILSPIKQLKDVVPGVQHVQERWDGKGYPDHLTGQEIPISSRIVAVANAYVTITSDRPYRKALPDEVALKEIASYAGVQFDPAVVEALIRAYRKGKVKRNK